MEENNYFCVNCQRELSARSASRHNSEMKHDVWYFNPQTKEFLKPYGKRKLPRGRAKRISSYPTDYYSTRTGIALGSPNRPPLTGTGDGHILQHYKGYKREDQPLAFVLYSDGTVRDMRIQYPDHWLVYHLYKKNFGYDGPFPDFLADCVRSFFGVQGYELMLERTELFQIQKEVARLIKEGKIKLDWVEEKLTISVLQKDKSI